MTNNNIVIRTKFPVGCLEDLDLQDIFVKDDLLYEVIGESTFSGTGGGYRDHGWEYPEEQIHEALTIFSKGIAAFGCYDWSMTYKTRQV